MAENAGSNGSSAAQDDNSQSANNQGNNDQSGQGNNQSADTAALQSELDKVKTALSEVLVKKDKYKGEASRLQKQFEEAEKRAAENATDPKEQQKKYEDIIAAQTQKHENLLRDMQREKINGSVKDAATKLKAVNPEQVLRYVKDDIIFDKHGRAGINDGKGELAINTETGKIVTIEEHVAITLAANVNFIQSSGNSGAGSSQGGSNGSQGKWTLELIKNFTAKDWEKHGPEVRKQAEAQGGLT